MSRNQKAISFFREGYNCAQSVILSYSDILNADERTLSDIASGFGGGMGKLQKTCGALTGSFMVIGLYNSKKIQNKEDRKMHTTRLVQQLEHDFSSMFGFSDCSLLTGVNLNEPEGQEEFKLAEVNEKVCEKAISACISWLEKNLLKN
jgi:C_GCAxxG_C_C family probable redox protein